MVQEPNSGTQFVDEDPIEQVWFICAKGNPNLQYRPLQALVRDDEKCVLTRLRQPTLQATHIMPNQQNNKRAEVGLGWTWIWLKAFWGSEKVKKWQDQITSTRGDDHVMNTEQIHNLMTLSIQVQHYWDSAICAFRPIPVNE
jgi:hypothetical protein